MNVCALVVIETRTINFQAHNLFRDRVPGGSYCSRLGPSSKHDVTATKWRSLYNLEFLEGDLKEVFPTSPPHAFPPLASAGFDKRIHQL